MHGVLASSEKIAQIYLNNLISVYEKNGIRSQEANEIYTHNLKPIVNELRAIKSRDSAFISDVDYVLSKWLKILTSKLPEEKKQHYRKILSFFNYEVASSKSTLFPEVTQVLKYLINQGYILHIASTAGNNHLEGIIDVGEIKKYFDNRVYGYESIKCFKNNIEYYTRLLKRISHEKDDIVILIGNSDDEAIKSKQAGIIPILINRERNLSDAAKKASYAVLNDLTSLPAIMQEIYRKNNVSTTSTS